MEYVVFFSLIMLLTPNAFAIPYTFEMSLKQQIDDELPIDKILCRNNSHFLVERENGKLACVYESTAKKLNWKLLQNHDSRENLWLNNNPVIKNCWPKESDEDWIDVEYGNSTHYFDIRTCKWHNKN